MNCPLPFQFHLASCLVHFESVQRHCLLLVLLMMHFRSGRRMAICAEFYWLCSHIYTEKKCKRIFTCSFIYSCMNTSILGGEKTSQHSSVRSNNKQAFLLLRRRQCPSTHIWLLSVSSSHGSSDFRFPLFHVGITSCFFWQLGDKICHRNKQNKSVATSSVHQ